MSIRVQVTTTQNRTIPVYKWEYDVKKKKHVNTNVLIREDVVASERILFSGSEDAYDIFKLNHFIPANAIVRRWRQQNEF